MCVFVDITYVKKDLCVCVCVCVYIYVCIYTYIYKYVYCNSARARTHTHISSCRKYVCVGPSVRFVTLCVFMYVCGCGCGSGSGSGCGCMSYVYILLAFCLVSYFLHQWRMSYLARAGCNDELSSNERIRQSNGPSKYRCSYCQGTQ
jgi:hypothetical protein